MRVYVSPFPVTCRVSIVGGVCVHVYVSPFPATCRASLVREVCACVCVTLSGDLPCES